MDRALLERKLRASFPQAAISFVEAASLPFQVSVGLTAVAVRDLSQKRISKAGTYPDCAAAGDTVYCAAREGDDATAALKAIDSSLKALGSNLALAVANTVYIDDVEHFKTMNTAYGLLFPTPPPTRTTVQQPARARKSGCPLSLCARTDFAQRRVPFRAILNLPRSIRLIGRRQEYHDPSLIQSPFAFGFGHR
jgi:enamine deaminase RidA (YjgF/YER057c/UK114 family)